MDFPTHPVSMEFRISGIELILDYELLTEKCSWSIFDTGGVELSKGILKGGSPHSIPIDSLAPNVYQLCVIDGDQLQKTHFRIS